jgi:hypothetical protein
MRSTGTKFGRHLTVAAASLGLVWTLGFATAAQAATHAKKAIVRHGYTCTVVSSKHHHTLVGHAGDVVCALSGNNTLTAVGPGKVVLIAGRGNDTLVGSSSPSSTDTLIGGSGHDTLTAGSGGDDVIETGSGSDSIDCGSGGTTVTVVGADSGDTESQDCSGGNVDNTSMQFEGTVTAVDSANPPANVTVSVSDMSDGASAWLAANPSCVPAALVFDLATGPATIETDSGGPIAKGDDIEVEANVPASGCSPVAVSVQSQAGDGNSQGGGSSGGSGSSSATSHR